MTSFRESKALLLALLLGACGGDEPGEAAEGPGGDDPFGNAAGSGSGNGAVAEGIDVSLGSGTAFGFGAGSVSAGQGVNRESPDRDLPCDRIDMVIAVDGSESMTEELEAMRDTIFPAFAERLLDIGEGVEDFRVATLDACPDPASFHSRGIAGECNFAGGNPWIENVSPYLVEEFACVGNLYQGDRRCTGDNDDEQPASAIATALETPAIIETNRGFLRGDALLVVIAITDEDEQPTDGPRDADAVFERLQAIVGGNAERMVFLGIGGSEQCQGVYGDAEDAQLLRRLTGRFEALGRGVFWDLCQGRLEDGLEEAFRVIDTACTDLPPPYVPPGEPLEPCKDLDNDCGSGPPPPTGTPVYPDGGAPF